MARSIPATQVLHDWWESKRGTRAMPDRVELDPIELKGILADFVLIDVRPKADGEGHAFTYRLAGTEIDSRFGIRLTGLTTQEIPFGDARESIERQYETAVREKRPVFCRHHVVVDGQRYVEYERLVVPLSGNVPGEVTALAAAVDFSCAYVISDAPAPHCRGRGFCDQIDLCLARTKRD